MYIHLLMYRLHCMESLHGRGLRESQSSTILLMSSVTMLISELAMWRDNVRAGIT